MVSDSDEIPHCIYCASPIDARAGYCSHCSRTLGPEDIVGLKPETDPNILLERNRPDSDQAAVRCPHCGLESDGRYSLCPGCRKNMFRPDAPRVSQTAISPTGYATPSTVGRTTPAVQNPSIVIALILLLVVGGIAWAFMWGPFSANAWLQSQMDQVLKDDSRNAGVHMTTYYRNSDAIVLDMQALEGSRADVFRVVLQFAERVRSKDFQLVVLVCRGEPKFFIQGSYFAQLGAEYSYQNPVYTMRTFPSHVYNLDGTAAYGTWTGGILGVLKEETEDFIDFHDRWYWNRMLTGQT